MRILVNGPTGTRMGTAIDSLKNKFCEEEKISQKYKDIIFKTFSIEDKITEILGIPFHVFLDLDDFKKQEDAFAEAFNQINTEIEQLNPKHAIISMNYPYFRDERIFPSFNFELLRKFNPNIIITFIDDAAICWYRITKKREETTDRSYFTLRDMFSWRSAATLFGDTFAKKLGIRNYIVSVKHPPKMLYRLIFKHSEIVKLYASFPISKIKDNVDGKGIIDNFRIKLHEKFCVFDPVTIDDRRVLDKDNNIIPISENTRWKLPDDFSMVSEKDVWQDINSFEIPQEQVNEVIRQLGANDKSIIDKQILYRDYRLILDSALLVAGRPFYKKHNSRGVAAEINYAGFVGRDRFMWWDPSEDGDLELSPFSGKGQYETDLDIIISAIETNKDRYLLPSG